LEPTDESPPARKQSDSQRSFLRLDLLIATIALIASISASIASVIQTRTLGEQFGASVWPYLIVGDSFDGTKSYRLELTNEGLGPALIRNVVVTLDGKPQKKLDAIVALYGPKTKGREVDYSNLGGGVVIRSADTFAFFSVRSPHFDLRNAQRIAERVGTTICYCSLLGNCWTTHTNATEPLSVASCGPPTPSIGLTSLSGKP
jgi:hypothetical protein